MKAFFKSLYLTPRLFAALGLTVFLFVLGFFFSLVIALAQASLIFIVLLFIIDLLLLYRTADGIFARRHTPQRLSNGDDNPIYLDLENFYTFPVRLAIVDEVPFQFQLRNVNFKLEMLARSKKSIAYSVRPVQRGEYSFGAVNVYAESPVGLISKRYRMAEERLVPVYPSYLQMRKYELLAFSKRLTEGGIKKVRRLGHTMEFEQIREYVKGDDFRTVNWKATARSGDVMVNQYQDEKSQPVYSVIDMGRAMKMPFEGLSLLDYAVNSSLVISNIALRKSDKAGLITFSNTIGSLLPAARSGTQLYRIMELLYNQSTRFLESDYEMLYATLRRQVHQRSLLLLFTNFESLTSMKRQLPFLKKIARSHLLVTIFFENTELGKLLGRAGAGTT
ncbi:MAG: DUF58 domain-containing protein, partial [Rhizobacter sp.]|nr:DUF58 domain-containing protein [Chlorobiales bacterium]